MLVGMSQNWVNRNSMICHHFPLRWQLLGIPFETKLSHYIPFRQQTLNILARGGEFSVSLRSPQHQGPIPLFKNDRCGTKQKMARDSESGTSLAAF